MGISPPADIVWKTNQALMQNAPVGLTELFNSCGCGSAANENALKASFLKYRSKKYGKDFDANEIQTAMNN